MIKCIIKMPYKIFPVRKGGKVIGYKVGKKDRGIMDNGRRYLSDKPLSKKRAEAQLKAVADNLHLLVSRIHRNECDMLHGECSRNTKVMQKLKDLVSSRGDNETFIMTIKSFPRGDELDRPNDDHLIVEYPRGKRTEANLIREVMEDTFGKNVVMKSEKGKNMVYDSFDSPINVTLMMRDGNNF